MLRKSFVLPILPLVLLSACRSGNETLEKQNAEILAEMKRINARLDSLEKQTKQNAEIRPELKKLNAKLDALDKRIKQRRAVSQNYVPGPVPANLNKLFKIRPLPANPTDQQIIEYVRQIREATIGQTSFTSNDPQIALYERIGPGHLRLLLPYLENDGSHSPFYLHIVLPKLAGEADKGVVRQSLKQYPVLIRCVVRNGWLKEMKKEILSLLKQPTARNVPVGEIRNCIPDLVQSPDDLKTLTDVYIHHPTGYVLLNGLKMLPGVDIRNLVNQAWAEAQKNPLPEHSMIPRAIDAVRDGEPNVEAVKYLLMLLMTSDNPITHQSRTKWIVPLLSSRCDFPLYDPPARLREWYGKNADRIVFDSTKRKYVVKK
jgi:hypothetical protein